MDQGTQGQETVACGSVLTSTFSTIICAPFQLDKVIVRAKYAAAVPQKCVTTARLWYIMRLELPDCWSTASNYLCNADQQSSARFSLLGPTSSDVEIIVLLVWSRCVLYKSSHLVY